MYERDPLVTVTIILPCKDSLAMVTARNSKMVDQEVELACLIFCQHLAELFNSQMGRYVLCVCGEHLVFTMGIWVYYLRTYSLTWFQLVYFQQIKFASRCLLLWSSWRIGVLNMKNLLLLSHFLNCDRFFSDSWEPLLAVKVGCYPWK